MMKNMPMELKKGKRKQLPNLSGRKKKRGHVATETCAPNESNVDPDCNIIGSDSLKVDEDITSDEDSGLDLDNDVKQGESRDDENDEERHLRVLQGITGMPNDLFDGKRTRNDFFTEAYPESEYNPSRDTLASNDRVTIEDLVESLKGKSGYNQLRKRTEQINKKSETLLAPLPKVDQDRFERKAAYESSKKEITRWDHLVKRNREAPSIIFDKDTELGFSSVGAIASEFVPRTDFEKKIAAVVSDEKIMEAHKEDGAKLLELNKVTLEDYKEQRNHIAKMRSLLFQHEIKMKRIKKIKSKTFRRISKKDRSKLDLGDSILDPEAAKEQALKQEFKRAEERMTLRHKNRSKWAKRILDRGLSAQDDGTRAAMAEQLNEHERLTRKMNSMRDSSSDDSSEEEEGDEDKASKLLTEAKVKTLKELEEDEGLPKTGLLSLPFMIRGLKKKEEEASKEAELAIQEYEESLNKCADNHQVEIEKEEVIKGKRQFGPVVKPVKKKRKTKRKKDSSDTDADSEEEALEEVDICSTNSRALQKDVKCKENTVNNNSLYEELKNIRNSEQKKTCEVSIFASGKWKKISGDNDTKKNVNASSEGAEPTNVFEEVREASDSESEEEKENETLSSISKPTYHPPSQEELVREAFAGDDVEEEFAKDKEAIINDENPAPEKPIMLPGWGQWTNVQKKKGLPSWIIDEHEKAKRKRDEALQRRKDANLKHVIISEKHDKKIEKLHSKSLPYPFTSKEAFDQSMRMPIGPEFNPVSVVGALNRPEVIKRSGLIIKPVRFEEPDRSEKSGEHKGKQRKIGAKSKSLNKLKPVIVKS